MAEMVSNTEESQNRNETPRKILIQGKEFSQAVALANLAIQLCRTDGSQPDERKLKTAWELVNQARDLVAPALSNVEIAEARAKADGGSEASILSLLNALR